MANPNELHGQSAGGEMNRTTASSSTTGGMPIGTTSAAEPSGASRLASQAGEIKDKITERVTEQAQTVFEAQKSRATGMTSGVARALHQAASQLETENDPTAHYIKRAADTIESFSSNLEQKNLDEMLWNVQRFARRNPAAFFAGAAALGFFAARFLKASSDRFGFADDYSYEEGLYSSPSVGGADMSHRDFGGTTRTDYSTRTTSGSNIDNPGFGEGV